MRASRRQCIHVQAYHENKNEGDASSAEDNAEYVADGVLLPPQDDTLEDKAAAAEAEEDVRTNRRSRNMLPCAGELRSGIIFESYGRQGRGSPTGMGMLLSVIHERSCVKCKIKRSRRPLVISNATLYTMGGRVAVRTGVSTCKCKKEVRYDGADSALVAFSSKMVFTRVYLDIVLHIALTSRSSLTATAAAMAFSLHVIAPNPLPG